MRDRVVPCVGAGLGDTRDGDGLAGADVLVGECAGCGPDADGHGVTGLDTDERCRPGVESCGGRGVVGLVACKCGGFIFLPFNLPLIILMIKITTKTN